MKQTTAVQENHHVSFMRAAYLTSRNIFTEKILRKYKLSRKSNFEKVFSDHTSKKKYELGVIF